jgi:F-type H+-transporting ATPase subunit delta
MQPTEQPLPTRHRTVLDEDDRHVARVYAEALYGAAERQGRVDEVLGELDGLVGDIFRREPVLELLLASPSVGRDRKEHILRTAFAGRASDTFVNFLLVLNRHERLGLARAAAEAYTRLHEKRSGKMPVQVRSAVPLTDDQRARLADDLRQAFGREPILDLKVDPDVLGGVVVRVGDHVYDASVRTRIDMIRNQLDERSRHGLEHRRDQVGP